MDTDIWEVAKKLDVRTSDPHYVAPEQREPGMEYGTPRDPWEIAKDVWVKLVALKANDYLENRGKTKEKPAL